MEKPEVGISNLNWKWK